MMEFDIRSLLVALVLVSMFCTAARVLLWKMHEGIPGLPLWAMASGLVTLALLLIILRGSVLGLNVLSLAQAVLFIAILVAWRGFRRFVGLSPVQFRLLAPLIVLATIFIALGQAEQSLTMRSFGNAMMIALVSALIARDLLTSAGHKQIAMRVTGWLYAANALLFALRAGLAIQAPASLEQWNPDGFAALPAFWWLCMTVATTLGMVLMTAERLQADLDRQASQDPLTGALNRRAFSVLAQKELARARRNAQPLSLLMMDLDFFKQVNDQLGHGAGDDILCQFVKIAGSVLREEDIFCRFGGEEFVALLPGASASQALNVADRLRVIFCNEMAMDSQFAESLPFNVSVSVGGSELLDGDSIDTLLQRADVALYQAKDSGRNCCHVTQVKKYVLAEEGG
jgi:diguanylate cyclase (GGDEF)-like protein